ncbi:MAG TPA: apolipoprotein N-acyltransferase [Candidatus Binatia bacterium]|nr:apolipoprotein N-acyltransferase [Candidatus Binatia bacterium]
MARSPGSAARLALACASGALYFACLPPLALAPLGFVALAPLTLAVRGASRVAAAALGWAAGTIACTALVAPSVDAAGRLYFGLGPGAAAASGIVAAQVYGVAYFALFGLAAREICARRPPGPASAMLVAAAWVACDFARATVGDGVPWVLLAHSQLAHPWALQLADVAGAAGPSFVLALASAAIAGIAASDRRGAALARIGGPAIAVVAAAALYGWTALARWAPAAAVDERAEEARVRVALVQGALPESWRSSLAFLPQALERMNELTRAALADRPDLVVWPENAVTVSVDANPAAFAAIDRVLPPETRLLVGGPRAVAVANGRAEIRNAAVLLAPGGRVVGAYDKRVLTPWAETAPWPAVVGQLVRPRRPDDYAAGDRSPLLEVKGHRFGVLICSEGLYADLARERVRDGAELLVAIANDGWFGGRAAREQHLAAVALRAIETRRFLVRATTSGITAVIAPTGEIVERAPPERPAAIAGAIAPNAVVTPYVRWGDAFAWASVVAAIAGMLPLGAGKRLREETLA